MIVTLKRYIKKKMCSKPDCPEQNNKLKLIKLSAQCALSAHCLFDIYLWFFICHIYKRFRNIFCQLSWRGGSSEVKNLPSRSDNCFPHNKIHFSIKLTRIMFYARAVVLRITFRCFLNWSIFPNLSEYTFVSMLFTYNTVIQI